MPSVKLTPTAIAAAVRQAKDTHTARTLKDPAQAGLELYVGASGKLSWYLQCRDAAGRPRRFLIGGYPAIGLSAARVECLTLREQVRRGADPTAEARGRREAAKKKKRSDTFAALLDIYERQYGKNLKSWPECRRRIESVFAEHLKRDQTELSLKELQRTADHWPSAQSAAAAVRYLRPLLKWAAHPGREYVARDLALITPPARVRKRKRVLDRHELSRLLPVLRASTSAYAAVSQFILLTLCRREEACSARWRDIDFHTRLWRAAVKDVKGDEPREVQIPLSRQAIALLRTRLPADDPDPDALVFTSDGGRLANWDRATKGFMAASKTEGWHRHDLRRTGATIMGDLRVPPHIVEIALNHLPPGARGLPYNFALYRDDVADALQRLADALDRIAAGEGEVVPLRRSGAE